MIPVVRGSSSTSAGHDRSIPSLDGLRALSVLTVILAHSSWYIPEVVRENSLYRFGLGNSRSGVTVFFVISGFLITNLLLRELDKTGNISLRHFYFRRSMRIFPAFYLYLLMIAGLWICHAIPQDPRSFVAALTYTWCYYPQAQGYFLQHSWSLSIEEQFYLFWPALMVALYGKNKIIRATVLLILLMPLVRLFFYFRYPSLRGYEYYLIYGWLDTMMVGCLLALINRRSYFVRWKGRYMNAWTASAMAAVAFYLNPAFNALLPKPYSGFYALVIYPVTTAICITGTLLYLVEHSETMVGRLLNLGWLRQIGILSYSLYLWQQILMAEHLHLLPYGYLYLLVAAALSFWLVEKPFLQLRAWIEARD